VSNTFYRLTPSQNTNNVVNGVVLTKDVGENFIKTKMCFQLTAQLGFFCWEIHKKVQ